MSTRNVDPRTVESFGEEWERFSYVDQDTPEVRKAFDEYFRIFPWDTLPDGARGADFGCGSGRWARYVLPRVGSLVCVDASEKSIASARRNLPETERVSFVQALIDEQMPIEDSSLDFAYSLGVLHHIPDTRAALAACTRKLKVGAPFLLYLYYALENRPAWYRAIWQASDVVRRRVSAMPMPARRHVTDLVALSVYWPLSRAAKVVEMAGADPSLVPLAAYRAMPMYMLKNDAYDRLATPLEQRFTAAEIKVMMEGAGLRDVQIGDQGPFWCAVGRRA